MFRAYKNYWSNYFNFSNCTSRKDFWLVFLMAIIVNVIFSIIIQKIFGYTIDISKIQTMEQLINVAHDKVGLICLIWYVINLIPSLSINVRRLHDIGKSGWAIFVCIIPLVGWIIYLIFLLRKTTPDRRFGAQV